MVNYLLALILAVHVTSNVVPGDERSLKRSILKTGAEDSSESTKLLPLDLITTRSTGKLEDYGMLKKGLEEEEEGSLILKVPFEDVESVKEWLNGNQRLYCQVREANATTEAPAHTRRTFKGKNKKKPSSHKEKKISRRPKRKSKNKKSPRTHTS